MIRPVRALVAAFALTLFATVLPTGASAQLLGLDLNLDLDEILSGLLPGLDLPDVDVGLDLLGIDVDIGISDDGPEEPDPSSPPDDRFAADGGNGVVGMPEAMEAVANAQALPLNELLRIVTRYFDGQVIDVALVFVEDSLYYLVKLLSDRGVVFEQFFEAATGTPVVFRQ